jgi:hypothetical protein
MIRASWILITPLLLLCVSGSGFQERGGREAPPPPPRGGGSGHGGNRTPKPKSKASLLVNVTPPDSTILLNEEIQRVENGTLERTGLAPGIYRLVVQREGYQPQTLQISLGPGPNPALDIALKLIIGVLSIAPNVAGSDIRVVDIETNALVGSYSGQARDLELAPGRYQILVAKEGYRTVVRDVSLKPASTMLLEPSLELLPKPTSRPTRDAAAPGFRPDSVTQVRTSISGKYFVVVISGRSGDTTNTLGTIDIKLTPDGAANVNVSGMLTGYPCQIDLVRLENVAEYSFVEPPGVGNQWARAVVRVRPKSSKRLMHFVINWKSLDNPRS